MTEGELWTRRVLHDLRGARYRPSAWAAFLRASFARSSRSARGRRRERRQLALLGLLGAAAWGTLGVAGRPTLAGAGLAWWVVVVAMLDWHLGMLEHPDGTRLTRLGAANVLGVLRAGAVPLLPALDRAGLAAALVVLGVTDVLDGPLARRRGEATRLGVWLDGTADTIVLGVAAAAAAALGALPAWIAVAVVARAVLPWVAAAGFYFATAAPPPIAHYVPARASGIAVALGIVLALAAVPGGAWVAAGGVAATFLTFAVSAHRARRAIPTCRVGA